VIDATKPDEFYVRHPYDAEAATLVPGLDIPIFSSTWDTSFLRAVINKVAGEPIHAQLLMEIAATYEDLNMWSEANLAYQQYLKTYFPMWRSREVWAKVKD